MKDRTLIFAKLHSDIMSTIQDILLYDTLDKNLKCSVMTVEGLGYVGWYWHGLASQLIVMSDSPSVVQVIQSGKDWDNSDCILIKTRYPNRHRGVRINHVSAAKLTYLPTGFDHPTLGFGEPVDSRWFGF